MVFFFGYWVFILEYEFFGMFWEIFFKFGFVRDFVVTKGCEYIELVFKLNLVVMILILEL